MKRNKLLKNSFRILVRHKIRSLFMILGIVIGISALTIITSLGQGTKKDIMDKVDKIFSANTIMLTAGGGGMESSGRSDGPVETLKIDDVEEILQDENIQAADPVLMAPGMTVVYQNQSEDVMVMGHYRDAEQVWNLELNDGRYFNESEFINRSRVALVGPKLYEKLFAGASVNNQQIRINNIPFQVIGVLSKRGIDAHGMDKDSEIIIPLTTLMERILNVDYIMMAKFQILDVNKMSMTVQNMKKILRNRHSISSDELDDFSIFTPEDVMKMINEMNKVFDLYLPILAIIALVVGGIVIVNLMLISVNERINEIGLRKAVGAKSKEILFQFLAETSAITIVSGLIGIVLGIFAVAQFSSIMDLPFIISYEVIGISLVASIFIGLTAGMYPAKKAAELEPVEALK